MDSKQEESIILSVSSELKKQAWYGRCRRLRREMKETWERNVRARAGRAVQFGYASRIDMSAGYAENISANKIVNIHLPTKTLVSKHAWRGGVNLTCPNIVPSYDPVGKMSLSKSRDQQDVPIELLAVHRERNPHFLSAFPFGDGKNCYDIYSALLNFSSNLHRVNVYEDRVKATDVFAVFIVEPSSLHNKDNNTFKVKHYFPRWDLTKLHEIDRIPIVNEQGERAILHLSPSIRALALQRYFCLFLPSYVVPSS